MGSGMYVYVDVSICMYMYVRTNMCLYLLVCLFVGMFAGLYVCMYICLYVLVVIRFSQVHGHDWLAFVQSLHTAHDYRPNVLLIIIIIDWVVGGYVKSAVRRRVPPGIVVCACIWLLTHYMHTYMSFSLLSHTHSHIHTHTIPSLCLKLGVTLLLGRQKMSEKPGIHESKETDSSTRCFQQSY